MLPNRDVRTWFGILLGLLLGFGQIGLVQGQPLRGAKARCACSGCLQVKCCPCDAPSKPVPNPAATTRVSGQADGLCAPPASSQPIACGETFAAARIALQILLPSAVHIYQRNCSYLI